MKHDFILIAGRPASGKTELLRLYCNEHPESTLLISEENILNLLDHLDS